MSWQITKCWPVLIWRITPALSCHPKVLFSSMRIKEEKKKIGLFSNSISDCPIYWKKTTMGNKYFYCNKVKYVMWFTYWHYTIWETLSLIIRWQWWRITPLSHWLTDPEDFNNSPYSYKYVNNLWWEFVAFSTLMHNSYIFLLYFVCEMVHEKVMEIMS